MLESLSIPSARSSPPSSVRGEHEELDRVVSQLDDWMVKHLREFDPFFWQTPDEAETRRKAFSELALYAHVRSIGVTRRGHSIEKIIAHLVKHVNSSDYIELIKRDQVNFVCYAAPVAFIRTIDRSPGDLIAFIESGLDVPAIMGMERTPNRVIEVWRFFDMLAVRKNPVDPELVRPLSSLVNLPNVFRCSEVSAYALTHVIMYLADFGRDRSGLGNVPARANLVLEALTLRFLAEEHLDLAIELALCAAIVSASTSSIIDLVINEAIRRIDATGTVNMPAKLMASVMSTVPDESLDWARQYHTMLVLASLLEHRARLTRNGAAPEYVSGSRDRDYGARHIVLGEAISSIAAYDLYRGSQIINLLTEDDPSFLPTLVGEVGRHISTLRRPDGYYGYYPDERHFIARNDGHGYDLGQNHELSKQQCDTLLARLDLQ